MADLVATCPGPFFLRWLQEGDCAGTPESGETWAWFTKHRLAPTIQPGERLYVVALGKLRGYAPVVAVRPTPNGGWAICRRGGAVACTIADRIPGFQGLRRVWWTRAEEMEFRDWKMP